MIKQTTRRDAKTTDIHKHTQERIASAALLRSLSLSLSLSLLSRFVCAQLVVKQVACEVGESAAQTYRIGRRSQFTFGARRVHNVKRAHSIGGISRRCKLDFDSHALPHRKVRSYMCISVCACSSFDCSFTCRLTVKFVLFACL